MTAIAVYANWEGLEATRIGWLNGRKSGASEVFEFTYEADALAHPVIGTTVLDPRLFHFAGPQYPERKRANFGVFADSSPDRWGRLLMQRRFERAQRAGTETASNLHETDYLLGVHDTYRSGALRFKRNDDGPFLDASEHNGAPPMVALRALEAAARTLEAGDASSADSIEESLRLLIAPGGSLGGARPKASVIDPDGGLWIAKFPSIRDEYDVGGWEMVIHTLAYQCGLDFAEGDFQKLGNAHHTFLARRFDRTEADKRLHFASAMTMTDRSDGDDHSTGASYLELADVLIRHGANTNQDLRELWSRIVFNMLVSNTDDHLRNHGFLLKPGRGWALSPAYDVNPDPLGRGLKLNVSEVDNAQSLELARDVAGIFRVKAADAKEVIAHQGSVITRWREVAQSIGLGRAEQERMAPAFALA